MHVALVIDEERLAHERAGFERLASGLLGEDDVTIITPETKDLAAEDIPEGLERATWLTAPARVTPWTRTARATRVANAMGRAIPDLVHGIGRQGWALAREVAETIERPVTLDVYAASLVRHVPQGRAGADIAAYTAPTEPIASALRQVVEPGLVSLIEPGTAVPPRGREVLRDTDGVIGLAIIGRSRDMTGYRAMLGGLSRVAKDEARIQAFLELNGPHEHDVWREVQRLDLLDRVSSLSDASHHRALLTQCDLLVIPERTGEVRGIVLDAMALGIPVVAYEDPMVDLFRDGETASIVSAPTAERWTEQLRRAVTSIEETRQIGQLGRQMISRRYRTAQHVDALRTTLQRVLRGPSYQFSSP